MLRGKFRAVLLALQNAASNPVWRRFAADSCGLPDTCRMQGC